MLIWRPEGSILSRQNKPFNGEEMLRKLSMADA